VALNTVVKRVIIRVTRRLLFMLTVKLLRFSGKQMKVKPAMDLVSLGSLWTNPKVLVSQQSIQRRTQQFTQRHHRPRHPLSCKHPIKRYILKEELHFKRVPT
jgi:hypothetical protein